VWNIIMFSFNQPVFLELLRSAIFSKWNLWDLQNRFYRSDAAKSTVFQLRHNK